MATTTRLLNLLSLLQTRRDWPGALLAERLDISHRTVRRDIDRLREMGYRIAATMGPDGGYRLDAGSELPPLLFDDDQVIALAVALQAATLIGVGIEEDAVRALTTVRQVMPSRLRHRLDALSFTTISAGSGDADSVSPEVLVAISAAVRAREVFRFDYSNDHSTDNSEITPPRRVEPHHLVTSKRRWYLVAWDLARDDWRIFRADRITPRTPNGPRFTPKEIPGGDVSEYGVRALQRIGTYQQLAVPRQGRSPSTSQLCSSLCRGRHRRRSWPRAVQSRSRIMVLDGAGSLLQPIRHRHRCRRPARTYPRFRATRRPQRRDC
nr:WYL domain-containing protein [Rhodococcus sp. YL-1]